jgi:hypothetical protein
MKDLYVAPGIEVLEMSQEGVICASGEKYDPWDEELKVGGL